VNETNEEAFIDRLLLLKETIKSAFVVDSLLRKSPTPVPQPPPPSAGVGAAAVPPSAGGGACWCGGVPRQKEMGWTSRAVAISQKARMRGRPYRYVFIVVLFNNRLTLSTDFATVIWRCGDKGRMRRRTIQERKNGREREMNGKRDAANATRMIVIAALLSAMIRILRTFTIL
jgi:hypothetical protein